MEERLINIELYKEIYTEELKIKNNIDSHTGLPANLIILLIGVGLFLFQKNYSKQPQEGNLWIGLLFAVFACILVLSIMYLMKMYLNGFSKYCYIPVSSNLQQKETELIEYYKKHFNKSEGKKLKKKVLNVVKIEFDTHLLNCYINSSSNNRIVNDERMKAFYLSKLYLMLSIILIAFIGFLIIQK